MANPEEFQLITDLSRQVIVQIAPEEMPIFKSISEVYLKNPNKALKVQPGSDEELGFGYSEAITLMSPYILNVVESVIKGLIEDIGKKVSNGGKGELLKGIRNIISPPPEPSPVNALPARLTIEQLELVRRTATQKARLLGLDNEKSRLLADAIVGSLSLKK